MKKVVVIGGGPAGMMAAAEAAKQGYEVTLLEKNNKLGKKLYITGNGRCNLTNACDVDTVLNNTPTNPYFLYSALYAFDTNALMQYFEEMGVPLKVEANNRVFPISGRSSSVVGAMANNLNKNKVKVCLNAQVLDIVAVYNKVSGVKLTNNTIVDADVVIIATGGLSYPVTGSTGDGYKFAKKMGHSISSLYPSLVPVKVKEKWIHQLAGLSLKNVEITLQEGKKCIYKNFGEMLFTHVGLSGPIIICASRHLVGKKSVALTIDLTPTLNEKQLNNKFLQCFEENKNKNIGNVLEEILPKKLVPILMEVCYIHSDKKVNNITKEERLNIIKLLKKLTFNIEKTLGYNDAVITCGGVNVNEINPHTMESKKMPGVFFAGEVIDVDSYTGGFNLQTAFSTGFLAGNNC